MANLLDEASILLSATAYNNGSMLAIKPENGDGDFTFSRNSAATRVNAQGLVENVAINLPRIDYTDGCGSWLLEPQSTNLIITSDRGVFGNNPGSEILTTSPDGTNTAVRPVPDSISDRYTGQISSGTYSTNTKVTYSWYRKRISTPVIDTYIGDLQPYALVNVTQVGSTIQIKSDINGFDRFSATFNITDGSLASNIRLYFGGIIGVGNSSVAYWGHQLEALDYATSLIPTSGSSVTRNQDLCTNSGNASLINSEEGVLYFEGSALALTSSLEILSLNDETYNNIVLFRYYDTSNNDIQVQVKVGGSIQSSILFTLSDAKAFNKIALKYKENDFALWVNGAKVGTDTSGTTFPADTLNKLSFNRGDGSNPFYGKTKALAVYKTALTDAQLTELTTI